MENSTGQTNQITFRYLMEFTGWLEGNKDKEIIDICTTGSWEEMRIVVSYRDKSE